MPASLMRVSSISSLVGFAYFIFVLCARTACVFPMLTGWLLFSASFFHFHCSCLSLSVLLLLFVLLWVDIFIDIVSYLSEPCLKPDCSTLLYLPVKNHVLAAWVGSAFTQWEYFFCAICFVIASQMFVNNKGHIISCGYVFLVLVQYVLYSHILGLLYNK